MNTETDRDLTTEEQEQLSGGLFFRDELPKDVPVGHGDMSRRS